MEYLPIFLPVVGVVIQVALWIHWGGRFSERVDGHDKRIGVLEAGLYAVNQLASSHASSIAVQIAKLDNIKQTVDSVSLKLDRKR